MATPPTIVASTPAAPNSTKVKVFIDGANLLNSAKRRFGYREPNADIAKLAKAVVAMKPNRLLVATYYYIGVPRPEHDKANHEWWSRKLASMGKLGIKTVKRNLKPRELKIEISGIVHHKSLNTKLIEKGIDLRLGLDLIKYTLDQSYDTAIIFSQDGDLAEAVQDAHQIAAQQKRRIKIECAFPIDVPGQQYGINHTEPVEFDRALYDSCIDPNDYSR